MISCCSSPSFILPLSSPLLSPPSPTPPTILNQSINQSIHSDRSPLSHLPCDLVPLLPSLLHPPRPASSSFPLPIYSLSFLIILCLNFGYSLLNIHRQSRFLPHSLLLFPRIYFCVAFLAFKPLFSVGCRFTGILFNSL